MTLNFTTCRESAKPNGVKVLVYGKSGTGKTVLCATAPKPVIISAEHGLLSLREHDIPVIEVSNFKDLQESYLWLRDDPQAAQFETVCLDSLTEIAEIVLADAKEKSKDARGAYGDLIDAMTTIVKDFRDLANKNVYMNCKEKTVRDDLAGTLTYEPSMPGSKLGMSLPYYFDEVFCLDIGTTTDGQQQRFLRTSSDYKTIAKDRSGALDEKEPPNLTDIFNKIKNITPTNDVGGVTHDSI